MKKIITGPIRFYKKYISPLTPPSCRYHPTCSTYALQAVEKHGAAKGGVMGLARILRCNPFVEGGVDEVPDYFTVRRNPDNIDDLYIPEHLMPVDKETRENLERLLERYEDQLLIHEDLPTALQILESIASPKEITVSEIKAHFPKDILHDLEETEIFPDLEAAEFQYFTLEKTEKNIPYLIDIEPYFEDTKWGLKSPLVVLEKTGIWYTNLPKLAQDFLIQRGVTPKDIKNRSFHLWLVLKALEEKEKLEE